MRAARRIEGGAIASMSMPSSTRPCRRSGYMSLSRRAERRLVESGLSDLVKEDDLRREVLASFWDVAPGVDVVASSRESLRPEEVPF